MCTTWCLLGCRSFLLWCFLQYKMHTVYSIQISHILPVILCGMNFYSVPSGTNTVYLLVCCYLSLMRICYWRYSLHPLDCLRMLHIPTRLPAVLWVVSIVTHAHYTVYSLECYILTRLFKGVTYIIYILTILPRVSYIFTQLFKAVAHTH